MSHWYPWPKPTNSSRWAFFSDWSEPYSTGYHTYPILCLALGVGVTHDLYFVVLNLAIDL